MTNQGRRPLVDAAPIAPYPYTYFADIEREPRKAWLIRDVIGAGELAFFYGQPKSGKSALLTDAALAIASSAPSWFGKAITAGGVVYIAAERQKVVERRVAAWRQHHGVELADFAIIGGVFDLASSDQDARRIAATVDTLAAEQFSFQTVLIIIDTLAQTLSGSDENSSKDIGAFINSCALIQHLTGVAVVVVHHTPLQNDQRMRGHGALLGAADSTVLVEKGEMGLHTARVKAANDAPDDFVLAFRMEGVTLSVDPETGEETTAPVVVPSHDALEPASKGARRERMPPGQRICLNALREAVAKGGERSNNSGIPSGVLVVSEEQWRQFSYAQRISPSNTPEARQKAFARASAALIANGKVAAWQGHVWLTERDDGSLSAAALTRSAGRT